MYPERSYKCASFTCWLRSGEFYTPNAMANPYVVDDVFGWQSDIHMWRDFVKPHVDNNPGFNLVHVYFPTFDIVSLCSSYLKVNAHPLSSKHAYMSFLDELIGEIIDVIPTIAQFLNVPYECEGRNILER